MEFLFKIWNIILETNTLNFVVFLGIIIFICAKINLPKMISELQKKTEKSVNDSKKAKSDSEQNLKNAQSQMKKLPQEVENIISDAKQTAMIMSEQITEQGKAQIEIIENNAQKVIENDIAKTKRNLTNYTAKASLELLENNIKIKLYKDKNLHQKYIDEAIDMLGEELERLTI